MHISLFVRVNAQLQFFMRRLLFQLTKYFNAGFRYAYPLRKSPCRDILRVIFEIKYQNEFFRRVIYIKFLFF